MSSMEVITVLSQIEGKMQAELRDGHPYEALQYVQSFVARKKKALGQDTTSKVVYHGAKELVLSGASSSAGTLLKWYLEEGAGVEYSFRLSTEELNAGNYCDVQRLIDLITPLTSDQAYPIIDIVYDPLHLFVAKLKLAKSATVTSRLDQFEALCAKTFLDSGVFYGAFKCYLRLGKISEAVETVNRWSQKGYPSEKALFFARAVLHLLSEGRAAAASQFLELAKPLIQDNVAEGGSGGGAESAPLAVWHLASILGELGVMAPAPRVDKTKLFGLLYSRYGPFLARYDPKLLEMFTKAGDQVFGFSVQQQQQQMTRGGAPAAAPANPMAMLQGLLGGGGSGAAGGMDMDKMRQMMNKMQGGR
eukprot:CAMPEP_0185011708 /NCGR_PEP_ID=MMETSP1098-20130426/97930_1 /TAXON_ID=89044 /ORGANISM="Spumella elongata, Strain CCAP 955/1" /LENGTH=361 /DNA_ID=CAMNT_0027540749 /DNA_START=24 /DNA_END=1109 /DNA_ORIENTATION=+